MGLVRGVDEGRWVFVSLCSQIISPSISFLGQTPPKATQSSSVSQGHSSRLPGCPRCFPEAPSWFWPAWLCLVSENKEKRCGGAGGRGGAGLRHAGRPVMARLAHVKTHQPQSSRKRVPFCMEWREYSATRGGHYVCRDPSSQPLVPMSFPTHVLA